VRNNVKIEYRIVVSKPQDFLRALEDALFHLIRLYSLSVRLSRMKKRIPPGYKFTGLIFAINVLLTGHSRRYRSNRAERAENHPEYLKQEDSNPAREKAKPEDLYRARAQAWARNREGYSTVRSRQAEARV
jgi:hypothetical protein